MPPYQGPRSLQDVLSALISDLGIRERIDDAQTIEAWATLAGPRLNALTDKAWVRGDRLYVRLRSAAWRHEMHLQRRAWRARLNEHLGSERIREIVFC